MIRTVILSIAAAAAVQADPPDAPLKTAWGRIEWQPAAALLHVDEWPAEGKIRLPRLNNPIGTVYLMNDPAKTPLDFQPGVEDWTVSRPRSWSGGPATLVMEVKGKPHPAGDPLVAEPGKDGSVLLPAYEAVAHGRLLRYEPQPHKNTLGYWADEHDWCEWRFRVDKIGAYKVLLLQGCGTGQGGSTVKILTAGETLEYQVEDTGHFQNFVERTSGRIRVGKAGAYTLEIRVLRKAKGAVMDVRQVRLVPEE